METKMQGMWGVFESMTSHNPNGVDGLILIRDGLTMALDGMNILLEVSKPEDVPKYDLEKITWTTETGPNGKYQKAVEQDNEDFRALINDLEAHDGKLQRNGFFIWKFSTGNRIGRKKQNNR